MLLDLIALSDLGITKPQPFPARRANVPDVLRALRAQRSVRRTFELSDRLAPVLPLG